MACRKSSRPPDAARPERWGSSEVWIAWKSCSGARVISSALNTKPASAASAAVASTASTGPLSSVCSATMIASTAPANPAPSRIDPPSVARLRAAAGARAPTAATISETSGAAAIPSATTPWPVGDPEHHRQREQAARQRLQQHEAAVEAEPLVAGQPSAREVARRVRQHGHHEHPVQLGRAVEHVLLDRLAERERHGQEEGRGGQLDRQRHPQRMPRVPERAARRDRMREQLLDRPVDDRDDQEQRRPQDRDALVVGLAQRVAGEREVREGDYAGRGDADRQDPAPRP